MIEVKENNEIKLRRYQYSNDYKISDISNAFISVKSIESILKHRHDISNDIVAIKFIHQIVSINTLYINKKF